MLTSSPKQLEVAQGALLPRQDHSSYSCLVMLLGSDYRPRAIDEIGTGSKQFFVKNLLVSLIRNHHCIVSFIRDIEFCRLHAYRS